MSQLYCTGRVVSNLELKTSQKNVPYAPVAVAEERPGFAVHTTH